MKQDFLRTNLANARGLGSAKDGTGHWWMQRVTAIALIPLSVWFVWGIVTHMAYANDATAVKWLSRPSTMILLIGMLTAMFYHAKLGLQVVIEDYVHRECVKITLLLASTFACAAGALLSILALLKLHFG